MTDETENGKSSNIRVLESKEKNASVAAFEEFKRNIELYVEMAEATARIKKAQYDAYIKEGFTPEQAMTLINV